MDHQRDKNQFPNRCLLAVGSPESVKQSIAEWEQVEGNWQENDYGDRHLGNSEPHRPVEIILHYIAHRSVLKDKPPEKAQQNILYRGYYKGHVDYPIHVTNGFDC